MLLYRASREYVYAGLRDLPSTPGTPDVYLAGVWTAGEWWAETTDPVWLAVAADLGITVADVLAGTAGIARFLVAGPDATGNPPGTIVLTAGAHEPRVRFSDSPELIVRDPGTIVVKP